ncbi:hypothetical protein [Enterococcus sp.]|uniref:hypothetical protein n=1 Tax=Enterococcus sp. TaxID=35783 RepID=UPI0025BBC197|nr:hypothetical protein [Enterococcus sp.]
MRKQMVLGLLGVVLFFAGCTEKPTETTQFSKSNESTQLSSVVESSSSVESVLPVETQQITGVSGYTYSLEFPKNWRTVADFESLNPDNDFMLSDSLQTKFLAAVVESKQDFADFDSYLALVQDSLGTNFNTDATFLPLPNTQTQMVDFAATVEGLNIHYLYYVIETDNNYVQLYGWTLESLFDSSKDELTKIMDSFQETAQ